MAGRPKKYTVDYFPHYAETGKTIYILETRYGNDGYAFWFKLLQRLCKTPGHILDAGNSEEWEFLTAKALITGEKATEILDLLSRLDAIDKELWNKHKLIWSQNLVENLKDVYRKRSLPLPERPNIDNGNKPCGVISGVDNSISGVRNTQSKVNKSKENNSTNIIFDIFWREYPRKVGKPNAEKVFKKIKPDEGLFNIIMEKLKLYKGTKQWKDPEYIPHPATWLNQRRWEDEIMEDSRFPNKYPRPEEL